MRGDDFTASFGQRRDDFRGNGSARAKAAGNRTAWARRAAAGSSWRGARMPDPPRRSAPQMQEFPERQETSFGEEMRLSQDGFRQRVHDVRNHTSVSAQMRRIEPRYPVVLYGPSKAKNSPKFAAT
jgi:hypothetical protein